MGIVVGNSKNDWRRRASSPAKTPSRRFSPDQHFLRMSAARYLDSSRGRAPNAKYPDPGRYLERKTISSSLGHNQRSVGSCAGIRGTRSAQGKSRGRDTRMLVQASLSKAPTVQRVQRQRDRPRRVLHGLQIRFSRRIEDRTERAPGPRNRSPLSTWLSYTAGRPVAGRRPPPLPASSQTRASSRQEWSAPPPAPCAIAGGDHDQRAGIDRSVASVPRKVRL
jgi:hypothetical protein